MNHALPGEDLIETGLRDLREGRESIAGLLVAIGSDLPDDLPSNPEHRLYDLLARDDSDSAHSRYNAYIRRLVSYERAAELTQGIILRDKLEKILVNRPEANQVSH
jgi:hypothetical protein